MSEPRDELSGGRHPDADDPLSRPLLHGWSPSRSVASWAAGHRLVAAVLAVVALAAVGGGLWARHSAERVVPADSLRVQADPSEYFLPGQLDDQGRTELLMLLQVDVAADVDRPVRLVGLDGGGISATETHSVTGSSARFTVRAQLACDLWLGGRGVQVRLRVGPGHGRPVNVPLDTGKVSPLGAQVTIPCEQFTRTHPLRLTSFGVSLDPTEPVLRSTWTVENRSATPITLSDALAVRFFGRDAPLAAPAPSQPTLLEPHGTTTVDPRPRRHFLHRRAVDGPDGREPDAARDVQPVGGARRRPGAARAAAGLRRRGVRDRPGCVPRGARTCPPRRRH